MLRNLKKRLVGKPLPNHLQEHERLPKWKALPVFASDAVSSVAYATEEILLILSAISVAAAVWSIPIALTICALLIIVSISYRQTISLYPGGGGAYTVAKENIGERAGLLAGSALMIDYILTVAVSISAGVAAVSSAFPWASEHRTLLGCFFILIMTVGNLRGARESGLIFSLPTYFFIFAMLTLLGKGLYMIAIGLPVHTGVLHEVYPEIGIFLLLRAFSSGCAALTGIEAISNGVPAFKAPSDKNAKQTMTLMVLLLGVLFLGVTAFAHMHHVVPRADETVLSQIAHIIFGNSAFYYVVQISTAMILVLAANTAFADFPRLASVLANDRFLPRQLANIGDRLVFSNGILTLGFVAALLVFIFNADTHALIPLYSVGVFMSFTLSQAGMVSHHLKYKEKHWFKGLCLNFVGATATAIVFLVVCITKFHEGAWLTILIVPMMLFLFNAIRAHYQNVGAQLMLTQSWELPPPIPSLVIIPISGFHRGVINAIQYARGISQDIRLCVVDINERGTRELKRNFDEHLAREKDLKLIVLDSPFRSVVYPVLDYLDDLEKEFPDRTLTVIVPEFVVGRWWHSFLHNQTAFFLKTRLNFTPRRVVVSVTYHLKD